MKKLIKTQRKAKAGGVSGYDCHAGYLILLRWKADRPHTVRTIDLLTYISTQIRF